MTRPPKARRSNKTQRLPDVQQGSLLHVEESRPQRQAVEGVIFERGDRARLFVGTVPLHDYLEREGLRWVLRLAKVLDELDWRDFEKAYKPGGRPPLHPRLMVGLMLYGLLLKQASLRQLEGLARRDVGAWWIASGLTPDHTTFTRFIERHEQLLSREFFLQVTSRIVKYLGVAASELAIDGTVVEAMASTSQALKREALEQKLQEAQANNESERVAQLQHASDVLQKREEARKAAGKDAKTVQVSPTEPEAVLQPVKNSDDYKLGYKGVIGVHSSGLIVGQAVSPSSEPSCVSEVLEQHKGVFGGNPQAAMLDAGFNSLELLNLFMLLDINALVAGGTGDGMQRKGIDGRFPKSAFRYDDADSIQCPAGQTMRPGPEQRDRAGRVYREFRTTACRTCPLHERCTKAEQRKLKRYVGEELKEAMAAVLQQPQAREAYARRNVLAEPAISRLRQNGLRRFTRRGERGARLEFALRCTAHNLALFLWGRGGFFFVFGCVRLQGGKWRLAFVAARWTQK